VNNFFNQTLLSYYNIFFNRMNIIITFNAISENLYTYSIYNSVYIFFNDRSNLNNSSYENLKRKIFFINDMINKNYNYIT